MLHDYINIKKYNLLLRHLFSYFVSITDVLDNFIKKLSCSFIVYL